MQGDEHNDADEELHLGRNSEIPTDPSTPSMKMLEAAEAARVLSPSSDDEPEDRRATDPSHPSHPSQATPSSARPVTAVERGPRKKPQTGGVDPSFASGRHGAPFDKIEEKPAPDKPDDHAGKTFGGKYRIDKLIAKGGMGRVYRATQFPLERPVAIKILNREFQRTDPQFVRRFFLEASTAAKLQHPHTITIFDYGEAESGELYIAMELLKGRPLSKVISADGPFSPARALKISVQICRALREAHAMGIIHRDLKPGNVFLLEDGDEPDYAKVLDFGLVKLFRPDNDSKQEEDGGILGEGDPELTRTGTLLGSPKYMSPEQIQGHALDPRTDIYSFGVILFQMISGKAPFTGATGVDVIYKHVHQPVPTIAEISPEVDTPAVMEAIIQRCLRKRREERYASMEELIAALKEAARMLAGGILSPDSMAEAASPLMEEARRVAKARATSSLRPVAPGPETLPPQKLVREAALREPVAEHEKTPAQHDPSLSVRVTQAPIRPSRVPLVIGGLGLLIAIGVAVVWMTGAPPPQEPVVEKKVEAPPSQPIAVVPARAEMEIEFSSEPLGAQVFEAGRPLGVTPFKKTFSIAREAEEPREFVFRLDGFEDAVRSVLFNGKLSTVSAKLEQEEAEDPRDDRPSKKKRRQSNKDNKDPNSPYRLNPY